jgi:hypothetical protein
MTTHVISLTSGKHRTFSNTQIAQALEFEETHEWRASENVVVRFDRRKGIGLCKNEEEASYHFDFLYAVVELIESKRMVLDDQAARVE